MERTAAQQAREAATGPTQRTIRAKRASVSVKHLKERKDKGLSVEGERALIRVGATTTAVLVGADDLSEWTDEDLRCGSRADKNGRRQGRSPIVVPKALHDELVKRTLSKANELFRDNTVAAVQALVDIATSTQAEDKDRIKASQLILERTLGKAVDRVEVTGTSKWEIALEAGIVSVGEPDETEDDSDIDPEED